MALPHDQGVSVTYYVDTDSLTGKNLTRSNQNEFMMLGFSNHQELKVPLFFLFLLIYLFTVLSNFFIIGLISIDSHLQKPMYFFICNMSFIDIGYSTVTTPNLLQLVFNGIKRISFGGCMTQLYFFNSFGSLEYMLLTSMAYDRYVAICHPLSYHLVMNRETCLCLALTAWGMGFIAAFPLSVLISSLCFCSSIEINHFFCDLTPLLAIACDDTTTTQYVLYTEGVLFVLSCFLLTLISYIYIISAILKISSRDGRYKAFSTCASHLNIVVLFYLMIACMYMKPTSSYSLDEGKGLSVLYVIIIPMLNPIIYSLRNNDVKEAFMRLTK
ncbi:olfactory receptor 5AR1-like [Dendropsophus ebraccatus]|uniref:olfactory receptor 5AR1-like n=1 Tax=Dendropsophus ebraccatus TaxID=150705 RepID=UPI0038316B8C